MKFIKSNISDISNEIKTGKTPSTAIAEYFGEEINWYTPRDLDRDKYLGKSLRGITHRAVEEKKAAMFKPNTVLIGCIGDIGKIGIIKEVASSNQQITGILPNDKKINSEFLYYWLKRNKKLLQNASTNSIVPILNNKQLGAINISYPENISDQIQIANLLSKSENLIRQRKESIKFLDKYLTSFFYEMFGDPIRNEMNWDLEFFEKLVAEDCPLTYGIVQPGQEFLNGVPVVRPVDLTETYVKRKGLKLIDPKISDKFKRTMLQGFEILMCVRGTTGVVSIASKELEGCNVTRGIVPIWFSESYNSLFAFFLLKSIGVQNEIQKYTYGATLQQINLGDLRKIKLIQPPLETQNKFAAIAQSVTDLKEFYKESLQELENLYGSLSQQAFKGKLEFSDIPHKEIGDPFEEVEIPEDKLPSIADLDKTKWIDLTEPTKEKPKKKLRIYSPFESASSLGKISNYKPVLADLHPFIHENFQERYFTFDNLKQATIKAGWQYDFETLKNFVFELLRDGKLKQVFADATFKSTFKEDETDAKKMKEVNELTEQMYLQRAAVL